MTDNLSRRSFISLLGSGFGSLMLADMLAGQASADTPQVRGPHFAPKAKHVILLFMTGGPSQMDLFDPKPALEKYAGQRPAAVDLRTQDGRVAPIALQVSETRQEWDRSQ
jgi:hypothetical protein